MPATMPSGAQGAASPSRPAASGSFAASARDRSTWEVLIQDHHEGYIGWMEFERNQRLITDNANGKSFMSRGSTPTWRGAGPGCCDADIVVASSTLPTAARTAARGA